MVVPRWEIVSLLHYFVPPLNDSWNLCVKAVSRSKKITAHLSLIIFLYPLPRSLQPIVRSFPHLVR